MTFPSVPLQILVRVGETASSYFGLELLRARIENIDVVLSELYICENKFPDKSSMGYYRLLGLIETIEDMSQKSYHFEYEL